MMPSGVPPYYSPYTAGTRCDKNENNGAASAREGSSAQEGFEGG